MSVLQCFQRAAWTLCVCCGSAYAIYTGWNQTLTSRATRKWFLKALGVQQFHKLLAGFDDKSAQAVCTFAYCEGPGKEPIVFQGRTDVSYMSCSLLKIVC